MFLPQKVSLRVLSINLFWCTRTDFIGPSHSFLLAITDARSCLERPLSCLSSWIPKQGSVGKEIQLNLHMQPPLVRPPIQKTKLFPVKAKQARLVSLQVTFLGRKSTPPSPTDGTFFKPLI